MQGFNLSALASTAGVMGLYKALQTTIGSIKNFAMQSIQAYSGFESMQKGLETFFQSAEKGKAVFEDLRKLSNETTFGVDELARSGTELLNVGVSANELNKTLVMIGNTAQGNKGKFAELVSIYSKIQSTGKAGAMQLQQLALRGLPIYDILKKIGVQGTATGEDIKKAFEEMTKEGGQFYNAMENINDTIEGKEGFISDYFREFKVNFAEVTGVADTYKNILDVVKEAIGNVSDWLLKVNENPIMKALFNGVLVGALTAIVSLISITLIGAIMKLNAQLAITASLKAVINPTSAMVGLAIAGLVGVTTYVKTLGDAYDEVNEKKNKALYIPSVNTSQNKDEKIESLNTRKTEYEKEIENNKKIIDDATKQLESYKKTYNTALENAVGFEAEGIKETYSSIFNDLEETINNASSDNNILKNRIDMINNELIPALENERDILRISEDDAKRTTETLEMYQSLFNQTDYGKKISELNTIKDVIAEIQNLKNATTSNGLSILTKEQLDNADKMLKEFTKKEREIRIKIKIENLTDWQSELQKAFNFSDKDVANGAVDSTVGALAYYKKQFNKKNELNKMFDGATGYNEYEELTKYVSNLKNAMKSLLDSGTYEGTEDSLREFAEEIKNTEDILKEMGDSINPQQTQWEEVKEKYGNARGMAGVLGQATSGTDAGTFAQSFAQTGNVFIAIIETLLGGLIKVIQSIDGWDDALNGVTEFFQALKPILEPLIQIVNEIVDGARWVFDLINIIALALKPFIQIFAVIIKAIVTPMKVLGKLLQFVAKKMEGWANALDEVMDWLDKLVDKIVKWLGIDIEEDDEEQQVTDLTQAYKDLISAMREMEEYYDERKAKLRGQQAIDDVTRVNDMILTPQGKFSTAPDDYIIATKNPSALGGKGVVMNVQINNTASNTVTATASQSVDENGIVQLMIDISQKVASDFAQGRNGWDGAVSYRQRQIAGRSVAL